MRGQCGVAVNSEHHVTVMTADRDTLKLSITEAEREVLGGAHLVIGIGLRGGTDAIGLLRDQGSDN